MAAARGEPRLFDVHVRRRCSRRTATLLGVEHHLHRRDPLPRRSRASCRRRSRELETAYEELQSTNEELETTNEELQSTNEELETTNEELQSTNEELETMNEELQSTNEELETINDELRSAADELDRVNAFLESILASLGSGVVVVDRDLRVQVWNRRRSDLWGLRDDEVAGQAPPEPGHRPAGRRAARAAALRAVEDGRSTLEEVLLRARNRRGRDFECRVSITPLDGGRRPVGRGDPPHGAARRRLSAAVAFRAGRGGGPSPPPRCASGSRARRGWR